MAIDSNVSKGSWGSLIQPLLSCQTSLLAILEEQTQAVKQSLETVGDDTQLANLGLQDQLQAQQQTLQMMSNISKMLHDTAMAIISKMRG